jgi:hypothetical protein
MSVLGELDRKRRTRCDHFAPPCPTKPRLQFAELRYATTSDCDALPFMLFDRSNSSK